MKWLMMGILLLVFMGCALDSASPNDTMMELNPYLSVNSANIGESLNLQILLDKCADPIFGLCFQLDYSEDYISYDSESNATIGTIFPETCILFTHAEDGIVHVSITLQQDSESLEATGTVCQLPFVCENEGIAQFSFVLNSIVAYDEFGEEIDCDFNVSNDIELEIN